MGGNYKKKNVPTAKQLPILDRVHSKTAISPRTANSFVESLLEKLEAEFDPEQVTVKTEDYAHQGDCFVNVEEKVAKDGGRIQYGWVIWQSKYLMEAEHHAVWENAEGNLIDVTPRDKIYTSIMFVPDESAVYTGTALPNVRLNVSGNALIDDYISFSEAKDALYAMGNRISRTEIQLPAPVMQMIGNFDILLGQIELFYLEGGKFQDVCHCKSGKLYVDCHHTAVYEIPKMVDNARKIVDIQNKHP